MANGDFAQLFQRCVERQGADYIEVRDAILKMSASVRPQLDAKLGSGDWREQMVAQILIGWIENRVLYEGVAAKVQGIPASLAKRQPISGSFAPAQRVKGLTKLGAAIVPRLLELLLKTMEFIGTAEWQTILQTLNAMRDDRAVMPLIDLVGRRGPDPARVFALGVLGSLRDPRGFAAVQSALARHENSTAVRSAAAAALGLFGDRSATAGLLAALQDPTEDASIRRHAARGLGQLSDPAAADALAQMLRTEQTPQMSLTLVQALGKVGGATAVAALDEAKRTHDDPAIRRAAEEAHRSLIA